MSEVIDRNSAKSLGLKWYFTGKPCLKGHVTRRRVHNNECGECQRISASARHMRNREKNLLYMKKYAIENKEKTSLRHKKYHADNREKRVRNKRELDAKNFEKRKKYRQERKERYAAHAQNRRARIENADGSFDEKDIVNILNSQHFKCANCKKSIKNKYHIDHIMPIFLGGSNWPNNLQALCPTCNYKKNAKHPDEWAKLNGRLL